MSDDQKAKLAKELEVPFVEHPLLVLACAAEVVEFGVREYQGAGVVELLSKLADVDDVSNLRLRRAVSEGEGDRDVRVLAPDELPHREFVEVRFEARLNDRPSQLEHRCSWGTGELVRVIREAISC